MKKASRTRCRPLLRGLTFERATGYAIGMASSFNGTQTILTPALYADSLLSLRPDRRQM